MTSIIHNITQYYALRLTMYTHYPAVDDCCINNMLSVFDCTLPLCTDSAKAHSQAVCVRLAAAKALVVGLHVKTTQCGKALHVCGASVSV